MNVSIEQRLEALEAAKIDCIPTFEAWKKEWAGMDALSKAVFIEQSQDEELFDLLNYDEPSRRFGKAVAGYLDRMGLLNK